MTASDDDAPEWSADVFARAEIKRGGKVVRKASGALTNPLGSMLERAARAAKDAEVQWNPNVEALHVCVARAVLMAVREPDDAMLLSARHIADADAYEAFTAMIDQILNETPE